MQGVDRYTGTEALGEVRRENGATNGEVWKGRTLEIGGELDSGGSGSMVKRDVKQPATSEGLSV